MTQPTAGEPDAGKKDEARLPNADSLSAMRRAISCSRKATVKGNDAVDAEHTEQNGNQGKARDQDGVETARRLTAINGMLHVSGCGQSRNCGSIRWTVARRILHLLRVPMRRGAECNRRWHLILRRPRSRLLRWRFVRPAGITALWFFHPGDPIFTLSTSPTTVIQGVAVSGMPRRNLLPIGSWPGQ